MIYYQDGYTILFYKQLHFQVELQVACAFAKMSLKVAEVLLSILGT